ncbi:MAG: VirB3 family type IV secretion system protein [Rhizobiaceae bacterium]
MAEYDQYSRDSELQIYPIVLGLTRPTTFKGVPLNYAMMSAMVVGLAFIMMEDLRIILGYVVLHAAGYALQVWDSRFIDIVFLKLKKGWTVRNVRFWGGNSYAP